MTRKFKIGSIPSWGYATSIQVEGAKTCWAWITRLQVSIVQDRASRGSFLGAVPEAPAAASRAPPEPTSDGAIDWNGRSTTKCLQTDTTDHRKGSERPLQVDRSPSYDQCGIGRAAL